MRHTPSSWIIPMDLAKVNLTATQMVKTDWSWWTESLCKFGGHCGEYWKATSTQKEQMAAQGTQLGNAKTSSNLI